MALNKEQQPVAWRCRNTQAFGDAVGWTVLAEKPDAGDGWAVEPLYASRQPEPVITDGMVLAGCRASHPALFSRGLEPLPGDGPATKATMAGVRKMVTTVLKAALSQPHQPLHEEW